MPVQMRVECHAFLGDIAKFRQAEHLKATAVRQNRTIPTGELVQAAHIGNQLVARSQMQMVGVAEHNLGADILEIERRQSAFDGCGRCDVHERRSLHRTMHGFEFTAACAALLFDQTIRHKCPPSFFCDYSQSSQKALKVRYAM